MAKDFDLENFLTELKKKYSELQNIVEMLDESKIPTRDEQIESIISENLKESLIHELGDIDLNLELEQVHIDENKSGSIDQLFSEIENNPDLLQENLKLILNSFAEISENDKSVLYNQLIGLDLENIRKSIDDLRNIFK